jgi:hypothetical protein
MNHQQPPGVFPRVPVCVRSPAHQRFPATMPFHISQTGRRISITRPDVRAKKSAIPPQIRQSLLQSGGCVSSIVGVAFEGTRNAPRSLIVCLCNALDGGSLVQPSPPQNRGEPASRLMEPSRVPSEAKPRPTPHSRYLDAVRQLARRQCWPTTNRSEGVPPAYFETAFRSLLSGWRNAHRLSGGRDARAP